MPLHEYACKRCAVEFEALVRSGQSAACPSCGNSDLERRLSVPAVKSEATRSQAMRSAKQRDKRQASDRMHERLRYEESHDRHG